QEMPLQKLRNARNFTQQRLADLLEINQSEISKIENRSGDGGASLRFALFSLMRSPSRSANLKSWSSNPLVKGTPPSTNLSYKGVDVPTSRRSPARSSSPGSADHSGN